MNGALLSDKDLREAAQAVRESMLGALPPPSECEPEFSEGFKARMERLFGREKRLHMLRGVGRCAVAALLALIVAGGAWLSVDAEARLAVFEWVRGKYENSIVYRFFNKDAAISHFSLSWIPEGFELEKVNVYKPVDEIVFVSYRYVNEATGKEFMFAYNSMRDGTQIEYLTDGEGMEVFAINKFTAHFYPPVEENGGSNLLLIDNKQNMVLSIDGNIDKADILRIAEGITPQKGPPEPEKTN